MKKFLILARVNGVSVEYTKFATCKRNAKKEFLYDFECVSCADIEVIDVFEVNTK